MSLLFSKIVIWQLGWLLFIIILMVPNFGEGAGAQGSRTRATQASPPRIIPTPAPTETKALPKRYHKKPTRVKQALPLHFIHEVTLWASPPENAVR